MSWIANINPAKHLFLKVFLYFWLATLVIFFSAIWLAKQIDSETRYLPLESRHQKALNQATKRLQGYISKHQTKYELAEIISRNASRHPYAWVVVDPDTGEIHYYGFRRRQPAQSAFQNFDIHSPPLRILVEGFSILGPSNINHQQQSFLVFLAYPKPMDSMRTIRRDYPWLFTFLMFSLSGGLCYLFVRSLLKPIGQLRQASKRMAEGELGVQVGSASKRLDEIGQLSRDFNTMSKQVENLLSSQKRLLADVSHELRSPLARLQLAIGIAQQQLESGQGQQSPDALLRIEKEALQIEYMIAQILTLSRLDNAEPMQGIQQIRLDEFMSPVIADAKFEAQQNNKRLEYQNQVAEETLLNIQPQLLTSAIENIIRNAIHYSQQDIMVLVQRQGEKLVWQIEDDGSGIEESQISLIFNAFYRESTARDRNSGGVGLGLAIAHQAIQKHQGTITAKNGKTGGLQVTVSIPIN
ncbi:ATP-binding protein [Paraglaciecola aestuariivivens]